MEHYEKGETVEVDIEESPFAGIQGIDDINTITVMRVKHGSKIRNLMGFAMRKIKDDATKQIIFAGSGPAVTKTIKCVEIMKRKIKTLHQISRIYFRRIEEYWEPKDEGLDRLKVTRNIPAISVLLSKGQLDPNEPGHEKQVKKEQVSEGDDATKQIIFAGSGPAVTKTITCVEIIKRKIKTLHQISRIYFRRIEEYWEPKDEGLDRLKVTRNIPAISVLLSKGQLDPNEPGYQAPGAYDSLWAEHAVKEKVNSGKATKGQPLSANKRKHRDQPHAGGKSGDGQSNQKKPPRRKNKNQSGNKPPQNKGHVDGKGDSKRKQQQQ